MLGTVTTVTTLSWRGPQSCLGAFGVTFSWVDFWGLCLHALSSTSPSVPFSSLEKQPRGRGDTRGTLGRQAGTRCRGREGREDAELELELDGNCDVPNYRERANHSGAS